MTTTRVVVLFLAAAVLVVGGAITIVVGMISDPLLLPSPDGHLLPEAERTAQALRHGGAVRLQLAGAIAAGVGILGILGAGVAAALALRRRRDAHVD